MKRLFLAAAGLLALSGSAFAADIPPPVYKAAPPPPAPVYNWTGCFIGAGGGYGMYNLRETTIFAGGVANIPLDEAGQGWLGIGSVGCDYQFSLGSIGNVVVGAFGDGAFANIRGLYTGNGHGPIGLNSGYMTEKSEWDGGGRIGVLITPNLLGYESVGYSSARFGAATLTNAFVPAPCCVEPSQTYSGWFLGSGLEYAFTWLPIHGLFLKTEYRYYDYKAKNLIDLTAAGVPTGDIDSVHPHVQTVTTELVYRFNWQ
jgi:outer membrane immunogenic protein